MCRTPASCDQSGANAGGGAGPGLAASASPPHSLRCPMDNASSISSPRANATTRSAAATRKTTGLKPHSRLAPGPPRLKRITRSSRPSERTDWADNCQGNLSEQGGATSRLLCSLRAKGRSIAVASAADGDVEGAAAARCVEMTRSTAETCAAVRAAAWSIRSTVCSLTTTPVSSDGSLQ